MDETLGAGNDLDHPPSDGGDGEIAIPLLGCMVPRELGGSAQRKEPGQYPRDERGQRANFDGGFQIWESGREITEPPSFDVSPSPITS